VNERFTLDRESFEQFIAAISLFQPLRQADTSKRNGQAPLLLHLLETLRDIDSGALTLQAALERVADLTLRIVGGDGAAVWLFTSDDLFCRAIAGVSFEDDHIRSVLRSKLHSAGAFGDDPPAKLDLARTLADCLGGIGSWLVIAILPGRKIAGGLAVFSSQSTAFTSRDFVHLRLLAGLAQYVATTSPRPAPIDDLYLPGLGTRPALGGDVDTDNRPHLARLLRERKERLTAGMADLVSSAAGIARDGVIAGAKGLQRTKSSIEQASNNIGQARLHRPVERNIPLSPSVNADQAKSPLRMAAQYAVAGLKSPAQLDRSAIPVEQTLKKLRRIRFLSLKMMRDVYEHISSAWERLALARAAASERFAKEAGDEVRLWMAQGTSAAAKVRPWTAQRFAAAMSALHSRRASATEAPLATSASSIAISPPSCRIASEAGHSRTPLQPRAASLRRKARVVRHHLRSATSKAGSALRRGRNIDIEVNWRALRKTAPAFSILGVMLFFVALQLPGRKPQASRSLTPSVEAIAPPVAHKSDKHLSIVQAARPAVSTSDNHLNVATAAVASPIKPEPASTESSHLRVTDRAVEATIAELSRYEIRNLPRAANYGDAEAALQLGMLYELGRGFPQSCSKAAEWITKAAQNGHPAAEYNLALRYRDGDGVSANPQEAENWFRKAAAHKKSNSDRVLAELPSPPLGSVRQ